MTDGKHAGKTPQMLKKRDSKGKGCPVITGVGIIHPDGEMGQCFRPDQADRTMTIADHLYSEHSACPPHHGRNRKCRTTDRADSLDDLIAIMKHPGYRNR